jgi:hypothetical protein
LINLALEIGDAVIARPDGIARRLLGEGGNRDGKAKCANGAYPQFTFHCDAP